MTKEEAENANIDVTKKNYYFKAGNGKTNMQPPAESADWFKLVSVDLENAPAFGKGDEVGVVTSWQYPTLDHRVTVAQIMRAQEIIEGGMWRKHQLTKDRWVGVAIAKALNNLDLANQLNRKRVAGYIDTWLGNGILQIEKRPDPNVKHHDLARLIRQRAPERLASVV
jgi:hypothetical protein